VRVLCNVQKKETLCTVGVPHASAGHDGLMVLSTAQWRSATIRSPFQSSCDQRIQIFVEPLPQNDVRSNAGARCPPEKPQGRLTVGRPFSVSRNLARRFPEDTVSSFYFVVVC